MALSIEMIKKREVLELLGYGFELSVLWVEIMRWDTLMEGKGNDLIDYLGVSCGLWSMQYHIDMERDI